VLGRPIFFPTMISLAWPSAFISTLGGHRAPVDDGSSPQAVDASSPSRATAFGRVRTLRGYKGVCEHSRPKPVRSLFAGGFEYRSKDHDSSTFGRVVISLECRRDGGPTGSTVIRLALKRRSIAFANARFVIPSAAGCFSKTDGAYVLLCFGETSRC
jgi:hypothetical protein